MTTINMAADTPKPDTNTPPVTPPAPQPEKDLPKPEEKSTGGK
jgi:hypothetical protein